LRLIGPDKRKGRVLGMRGTVPPAAGLMQRQAKEIASLLREARWTKCRLASISPRRRCSSSSRRRGMKLVHGQQVMLDAREIKNIDEIVLLNRAAHREARRSGGFSDVLQSYQGYRTCYYRTFNVRRATPVPHDAYKKCREW
jgi:hypothetical protein